MQPGDIIAALDVGSSKVCSLIAVVEADMSPRIIGIGHRVSRGVNAGAVVDMEETEAAIRAHLSGTLSKIDQIVANHPEFF